MYTLDLENADGSLKWELPYSSISLTEELNKGVDGNVTIAFKVLKDYASALNTTPDGIVAAAARYWKLRRDGTVLHRGVLTHRRVSGGDTGATSYTLNISDISSALAKRRTASEVLYAGVDSADIAWDLIDDTQNDVSTHGALGIIRGTHPATVNRDRTLRFDNIRDVLVGMSNLKVSGGYDFDFDVSNNFNIYYPTKGSVKSYIVIDDYNIISWSSDRPLQGKLTNRVIVLGKGQAGIDMVSSTREDTTPMATWGLCADVVSEKGVEVVAELEDRGDNFLDLNKTPHDTITVTVSDTSPDLQTYAVGDSVKIKISDIDLDTTLRIKQRTINIRESGKAIITLGLETT